MGTWLRNRLTYANIVATIALCAAVGGTSWALTVTGSNVKDRSLTGIDLKRVTLTSDLIAPSAIGSGQIASNAVTSADIANSTITSSDLNAVLASQVINQAVVVATQNATIAAGGHTTSSATCGSGSVVGGGATFSADENAAYISRSWPSSSHDWSASIVNTSGSAVAYTVYAVCLS